MPRRPKPWRRTDAGGAWYAQVRGHQVRLADAGATFEEALAILYELLGAKPGATTAGPEGAETIRTDVLCDRFIDHVQAERKPLTYEWYRRHLANFLEKNGDRPAPATRPHHVLTWANSHGWGPSNRRGAITAVKAAFAWGRKMGYLETDPIRDLAKPAPVRREKIMSEAQTDTAIGNVSARFARFLEFLRETGARPGEARATEAKDVDWGRGLVVLAEHKTESTTGKPRVIALSVRALAILTELAAEFPKGPLFRNTKGRPWTRCAISLAIRRLRKKTGFGKEATAQAMRHRFATDAAKTLPNTMVAALLGHKSTAMVDRVYSHLGDEVDVLRAAVRDHVRPTAEPQPKPVSDSDSGSA